MGAGILISNLVCTFLQEFCRAGLFVARVCNLLV